MKKLFFVVAILAAFSLNSLYSQKPRDVVINEYLKYESNNEPLVQTKNDLTVELVPLSPELIYSFPELFSFRLDQLPSEWTTTLSSMYQKAEDGNYYEYPFGADKYYLNVFRINIKNNTDRILRMGDARIYMIVPGENPISPVVSFGDPTLVRIETPNSKSSILLPQSAVNNDGSLIHWVTAMYNEWEKNRKKGILYMEYPIGFPSQVMKQNIKAYNLINSVDAEILPKFSYSGLLLFPRFMEDETVSIMLYDLTTKTDAAGNVVEKSNFQFTLNLAESMMYYDRTNKTWVTGNPPQRVEYYDRKTKSWHYGSPR